MGHQQKLLLVSSLFLVGVGIIVGVHKYYSAEAETNMNAIMVDVLHIANRAQSYYFKPKYLNGGGRSFAGLTEDQQSLKRLFGASENENGTYQFLPSNNDQTIIIQAIGKHDTDDDGENFTVQVKVYPDSTQTFVLNR